ncbi:BglG family transcription antiterminator [Enterococcus sp. CWB-B31]|uniref:BglG family transcription antiterminator n=1 Tax=Enterococcus sp. CWB-B31 TaxID=2885159 RepID=UPI001E45DE12|nr:BglG family transcription antiterminator [Enterococcus sp. CWB-B31]MCB5953863.1 BglG family transcription antiterminator [Enterococcus sp. CWB-B31]
MKAKYIKLLQYLNEQGNWVSSTLLAEKFGLSKRTIKSYISDIQTIEPDLVVSSSRGYRVESGKLAAFFNNIQTSIPETPAERAAYLLLRLISTEEAISVYDLAEELYISESTLLNDAKKLKKQCLELSLEIRLIKDTLQLIGTEKAKRQLIHTTLLSELDNHFVDITKLQESFVDFDLDYIKEIIAELFSDYDFFTNDYALTNIVIHLAIAVDRMKGNFQFPKSEAQPPQSIHPAVLKIAEKIAGKVAERYNICFPKEEIRDLAILISANGTSVNFTQISAEELEQVADKRCLDLVGKILEKVHELYFIDGNEPEFFIRFALHIKNLLYRIDNGYSCRNPMTETLKKECPLIYDCAVQVSHVIQKELDYTISEDEIAYIAFHLGYALEIQKQRTNKINCTILVPHYYNMNIQVMEKLQKNFVDDLEIQNILTSEKELKYVDTELIVSAVKLKQVVTTPYVVINPFFTLEDRQQIASKIFDIKEKKRRDQFAQNFLSIVDEGRFIYTTENQNSDELLKQLCSRMEEEGMVDERFYPQVMEREQLSSTAFGSVAIPHSLTMNANRTGISIVVNPNGIAWGSSRVTLVFLISINYRNRHVFREIFDDLAMICTDEQNVHRLSSLTSFEEFVDTLVQCFVTSN